MAGQSMREILWWLVRNASPDNSPLWYENVFVELIREARAQKRADERKMKKK